MQSIVADMFGVENKIEADNIDRDFYDEYMDFKNANLTTLTAAIEAMYESTQEFFRSQGITHVRAHRGIQLSLDSMENEDLTDSDKKILEDIKQAQANPESFDFTHYPLSSWSFDPDQAVRFANMDLTKFLRRRGVVMVTIVPIEDIFSLPYFGLGALDEYELVLVGNQLRLVQIVDVTPDEYRDYEN
jgi:hypothetical protein